MLKVMTLDVETTYAPSPYPWVEGVELVSVHAHSLHTGESKHWLVEHPERTQSTLEVRREVQAFMNEHDVYVNQNVKFDMHWLDELGVDYSHMKIFCTMVAQYLLSGQQVKQPSLNSLAEYYGFPLKLDQVRQMWDAGIQTRDVPADILIKYGDYDAVLTGKVFLKQAARLTEKRMWSLMWTQMQELRMLKNAERAGMLLDLPYLHQQADQFEEDLTRKDRELLEISGNQIFNLNAPAQKAALFFGGTIKIKLPREEFERLNFTEEDKLEILSNGPKWITFTRHVTGLQFSMPDKYPQGKTGPSVDTTALAMLTPRTKEQRTALAIVKDRNTLSKMLSTYLRGLPKKVRDGSKVHTWFKQAWTITGRISSEDPNLMNIPRDKTGPVKRAFITRF